MTIFTHRFVAASLIAATTVVGLSRADAVTFPSLTTIYIGVGVRDNATAGSAGIATAFNCTNVSGVAAQLRILVLSFNGAISANHTLSIPHGHTRTVGTDQTNVYSEDVVLVTGSVNQGVVNIESTQSGVFCNGIIVDDVRGLSGISFIRVNPHPGTVE
jgi:hypothetical protein